MFTFNSLYFDGVLVFGDDGKTVTLKIRDTGEEYFVEDKYEYKTMLDMLQHAEYKTVLNNDVLTFSEKVIRLHEKREKKKNAAR
jgi:hypothetical protein